MLRSNCFAFASIILSLLVTAHVASAQTFEESMSPATAAPPVDGRAIEPQKSSDVTRASSEPLADRVEPKERTWYGAAILGTDVAALGLGVLGLSLLGSRDTQELGTTFAIGGGLTYLAGGPIVHAAHGNIGTAFGSLGLRAGVPIAGAYIGATLGSAKHCSGESCEWDGWRGGAETHFSSARVGALRRRHGGVSTSARWLTPQP